jgi:hypothetical protein
MQPRILCFLVALLVAGCAQMTDPAPPVAEVSCGGPDFPITLLDEPGRAERSDDPAAAALRTHLAQPGQDFNWLPDAGWREVRRTDAEVNYVADALAGADPPYVEVSVTRDGDRWRVAGWGQCRLQPSVGPGLGLASFRVAPEAEPGPGTTEIPVLVTERACNSGQDARGRIVEPQVIVGGDAITVVFAVRPREGEHECPSNPETPHLLVLPEPLGNRTLLDGSEIPARDATTCAGDGLCPP